MGAERAEAGGRVVSHVHSWRRPAAVQCPRRAQTATAHCGRRTLAFVRCVLSMLLPACGFGRIEDDAHPGWAVLPELGALGLRVEMASSRSEGS